MIRSASKSPARRRDDDLGATSRPMPVGISDGTDVPGAADHQHDYASARRRRWMFVLLALFFRTGSRGAAGHLRDYIARGRSAFVRRGWRCSWALSAWSPPSPRCCGRVQGVDQSLAVAAQGVTVAVLGGSTHRGALLAASCSASSRSCFGDTRSLLGAPAANWDAAMLILTSAAAARAFGASNRRVDHAVPRQHSSHQLRRDRALFPIPATVMIGALWRCGGVRRYT